MIQIRIACAKSKDAMRGCEVLKREVADFDAAMSGIVSDLMDGASWTRVGLEFYCPRHDPIRDANVIELDVSEWRTLGESGYEARFADGAAYDNAIEIRTALNPAEA